MGEMMWSKGAWSADDGRTARIDDKLSTNNNNSEFTLGWQNTDTTVKPGLYAQIPNAAS